MKIASHQFAFLGWGAKNWDRALKNWASLSYSRYCGLNGQFDLWQGSVDIRRVDIDFQQVRKQHNWDHWDLEPRLKAISRKASSEKKKKTFKVNRHFDFERNMKEIQNWKQNK